MFFIFISSGEKYSRREGNGEWAEREEEGGGVGKGNRDAF
jgi:hypothetical protein